MGNDRDLTEFAQAYHADVLERAQEGPTSADGLITQGEFKESVFTRLVIEDLQEVGAVEDAQPCYYARRSPSGHMQANGYGVDETTVNLFVTFYTDSPEPIAVAPADVRRRLAAAERFYHEMANGGHEYLEPSSDAHSMGELINRLAPRVERLRLFFLTDGFTSLKAVEDSKKSGLTVATQIWDIERLFRSLATERPHESIEIDLIKTCGTAIPCLPVAKVEDDYHAYLCVFPGSALADLYDEYGARLLELNVRSFLQARGKVNRGIRDTIREDPGHFFPFNNGLSVTAAEVRTIPMPGGGQGIAFLRGLQIVNGGQTTASLHRAGKIEKADLSRVFVQAKVTVVTGDHLEEMVPQISKYANSQNAVNEADLSANHPFHVELARLADTIWNPGEQTRWFYERARGEYQVAKQRAGTPSQIKKFEERTPNALKFTKLELAKFVNAYEQLPHIVSRGGQASFVGFMDRLREFGKDYKPDADFYRELIGMAILFRETQRIVAEIGFPAYRANIVAYTVAMMSFITDRRVDLVGIWRAQGLSAHLIRAIGNVAERVARAIVETAGDRNVTQWAKRRECWEQVQQLDIRVPAELTRELLTQAGTAAAGGGGGRSPKDLQNIAACKRISAESWQRVYVWGARTKNLPVYVQETVALISNYAAAGWVKSPTGKEAKQALEAYSKAQGHVPNL